MSVSFTRTREQLRDLVLSKLGVKAAGVSAASADQDLVVDAMDMRLKEIQRLGIFWRKVDKVPVTFSLSAATQSAHALSADIAFPIKLTVADGSLDEPVSIIGIREWAAISDKNQAGFPTKALWKGSTEFMFHPISATARTAKLVYERIADDTTAGSAPDIEVSMLRSLRDMITYDCADYFGLEEQKIGRFAKEAQQGEFNIRKLSAQRVASTRVAVDDWDEQSSDRRDSDYGF